jgi:hypothetical protein
VGAFSSEVRAADLERRIGGVAQCRGSFPIKSRDEGACKLVVAMRPDRSTQTGLSSSTDNQQTMTYEKYRRNQMNGGSVGS